MKRMKRFFDVLPALLMWLVLSIFLWGFVFNVLTNIPREEKIVLFADAPLKNETELALTLEEGLAEPLRAVQVREFAYAMMGSDEIEQADLYIVAASQVESYLDWFAPLPPALQEAEAVLEREGIPLGVRIYDSAAQSGAAMEYIRYGQEDYYLLVGKQSLHVQGHENAADNQAVEIALRLLSQTNEGGHAE